MGAATNSLVCYMLHISFPASLLNSKYASGRPISQNESTKNKHSANKSETDKEKGRKPSPTCNHIFGLPHLQCQPEFHDIIVVSYNTV